MAHIRPDLLQSLRTALAAKHLRPTSQTALTS